MRLWQESTGQSTDLNSRDYETVGYVISGTAELESEGQIVALAEGDSWVMPRGAAHRYRTVDEVVAVEATSPPAHAHGRDEPPS